MARSLRAHLADQRQQAMYAVVHGGVDRELRAHSAAYLGSLPFDGFAVGENIAAGYGSSMSAVVHGWMCSAGHRANIMNADYNELGTGVVAAYYTQDFGAGVVDTMSRIAMGNHSPETPSGVVDFTVDYQGDDGDVVEVVQNAARVVAEVEVVVRREPTEAALVAVCDERVPRCHEQVHPKVSLATVDQEGCGYVL